MDVEVDDYRRLTIVRFTPCDPLTIPGAMANVGRRAQIEGVIKANGGQAMTPADIVMTLEAEGIRITEANVRSVASQNPSSFTRLHSGQSMAIGLKDNVYSDG